MSKLSLRWSIAAGCALLLIMSALKAAIGSESEPMAFDGYAPPIPQIMGTAWDIFEDGVIDLGAKKRLERFLIQKDVPYGSSFHINSDGGNLLEGMMLGRLIRKYELLIYVNRRGKEIYEVDRGGRGLYETGPGECYSACALAFLGGVYRFRSEGSIYGVHRFYAPKQADLGSDAAQIASAQIVQYIRDMGLTPACLA
jgi:hypothetical protein